MYSQWDTPSLRLHNVVSGPLQESSYWSPRVRHTGGVSQGHSQNDPLQISCKTFSGSLFHWGWIPKFLLWFPRSSKISPTPISDLLFYFLPMACSFPATMGPFGLPQAHQAHPPVSTLAQPGLTTPRDTQLACFHASFRSLHHAQETLSNYIKLHLPYLSASPGSVYFSL